MYDYNYGTDYINPGFNASGMEESIDLFGKILGDIAIFGIVVVLITLTATILLIISNWKIFEKAKRNGWESLVPIHNMFVLLEIAGTPTWHIFLFFLPIANIYVIFRMYIDLAHKFGKSTGFGVATVFFNIICLPILAFSKKIQYNSLDNDQAKNNEENVMPIQKTEVTIQPEIPLMNNAETVEPVQTQSVLMTEPVNLTSTPVVEPQPVHVETPVFIQTMPNTENVVQVQNTPVTQMQPMYTEPTPIQNVVSQPTVPVQNEVPTEYVMPQPVTFNTPVMPEPNNNNQTGQMM